MKNWGRGVARMRCTYVCVCIYVDERERLVVKMISV